MVDFYREMLGLKPRSVSRHLRLQLLTRSTGMRSGAKPDDAAAPSTFAILRAKCWRSQTTTSGLHRSWSSPNFLHSSLSTQLLDEFEKVALRILKVGPVLQ
jgi:hypothetical protein